MTPHTLTAVPAKAAGHVCGLDGALLTGLQKHKQPLELVRDTVDRILLRLLKLPTGAETLKTQLFFSMVFAWSQELCFILVCCMNLVHIN